MSADAGMPGEPEKRLAKLLDGVSDCLLVGVLKGELLTAFAKIEELTGEVERLREEAETMRMQAVACMTATIQNTRESAKDRIGRDNPYWTQAYADVCAAVDREMTQRERAEQAEQRAAEEAAIVDKIWDLFGRPSYKDLNGRSIYDLITDVQQRAADLENVLNHLHDDPKRAQAYFWNYQGRKQRMEAIRADMKPRPEPPEGK